MSPILFLLLVWSLSTTAQGYRTHGEGCSPALFTSTLERDTCDPRRSLICERRYNRCDCLENMVWVPNYDRCSYKIGFPCAGGVYGSAGGVGLGNYAGSRGQTAVGIGGSGIYGGSSGFGNFGECPPNGYCDPVSRQCVCDPYHYPNSDGSYCNSGERGMASLFGILILTFILFKIN